MIVLRLLGIILAVSSALVAYKVLSSAMSTSYITGTFSLCVLGIIVGIVFAFTNNYSSLKAKLRAIIKNFDIPL